MPSAPTGPTKPDAGVIAASPATLPVTIPSTEGRPARSHSIAIQVSAAVAAEICVTTSAIAALPLAPSALPALKPNQPTQSMPVPATVSVRLWGGIGVVGQPRRTPSTSATTSAATPAVMCTTIPPAKSNTPRSKKKPPGPLQVM